VKAANNPNVVKWVRNRFPHPYSEKDALDWINLSQKEEKKEIRHSINFSICEIDNEQEVIGGIGFELNIDVEARNGEVGYWLSESHWGKGYISEALPMMCNFIFSEKWERMNGGIQVERMEANIFEENIGSQKVLEKCGFQFEAKMKNKYFKRGSFHNSCFYVLFRNK